MGCGNLRHVVESARWFESRPGIARLRDETWARRLKPLAPRGARIVAHSSDLTSTSVVAGEEQKQKQKPPNPGLLARSPFPDRHGRKNYRPWVPLLACQGQLQQTSAVSATPCQQPLAFWNDQSSPAPQPSRLGMYCLKAVTFNTMASWRRRLHVLLIQT